MVVNFEQLNELLTAFIPARCPMLVTGKPGIGKTSIIESVTAALGYDLIIEHPSVSDPTDYKGLPWGNAGASTATFLPFGNLAAALTATRPTVWFFDDLGQATPAVQAACMQLFLARRINGHILPDCVTFLGATNRRVDRAGVSGILEPVKSRFVSIVELEADLDGYCRWADGAGINESQIAFHRFRPGLLCDFQPTADLTNSPLPRTWHNLDKIEKMGLSPLVEAAAMSGAVGEGAAGEFLAFRKIARSLPSLDAILMDPSRAKIPTSPSELYAVTVGLARRANDTNFDRIAVYANRLYTEANRGEFAVMLIRDSQRRDPKIQYTDSFVRLQSGPIGQLISGRA